MEATEQSNSSTDGEQRRQRRQDNDEFNKKVNTFCDSPNNRIPPQEEIILPSFRHKGACALEGFINYLCENWHDIDKALSCIDDIDTLVGAESTAVNGIKIGRGVCAACVSHAEPIKKWVESLKDRISETKTRGLFQQLKASRESASELKIQVENIMGLPEMPITRDEFEPIFEVVQECWSSTNIAVVHIKKLKKPGFPLGYTCSILGAGIVGAVLCFCAFPATAPILLGITINKGAAVAACAAGGAGSGYFTWDSAMGWKRKESLRLSKELDIEMEQLDTRVRAFVAFLRYLYQRTANSRSRSRSLSNHLDDIRKIDASFNTDEANWRDPDNVRAYIQTAINEIFTFRYNIDKLILDLNDI